MKACFEACAATSETQAAAAPCCLLARAVHVTVDKLWFSVVFYLTPEGLFHQAMVQGLESWCWRWDLEGDVRSSSAARARGSSCTSPTQIAHKNDVICFWMPKASFCSGDLWFGTAGRGGLNETGTAAAKGLTPPGAWGCGGCGSRAQVSSRTCPSYEGLCSSNSGLQTPVMPPNATRGPVLPLHRLFWRLYTWSSADFRFYYFPSPYLGLYFYG